MHPNGPLLASGFSRALVFIAGPGLAGLGLMARMLGAEPTAEAIGKLPPALGRTVDIRKDVQPILEAGCVKSHGRGKAKGDWNIDPNNAVMANLGLLLDKSTAAKPLWALFTSLDLFSFWQIFLLACGFGVASRKTQLAVGFLF